MQETIPISKFKATCLHLLKNVKKIGKSILVATAVVYDLTLVTSDTRIVYADAVPVLSWS